MSYLPHCPACREKMSSTEYGRYDAFLCFYCDGVWLPATAVDQLLARHPELPSLSRILTSSAGEMWDASTLQCPTCDTHSFRRFTKSGIQTNLCCRCGEIYFPKGAFEQALPGIEKDEFPFSAIGGAVAGEAVFWAALAFFAGLK